MALYKYPQNHAQLLFLVNLLYQSGLLSPVHQIIGLPIQLTLLTPSTVILLSLTLLSQRPCYGLRRVPQVFSHEDLDVRAKSTYLTPYIYFSI